MGVVIFNGRSSLEYGILVEHPPEYQMPERDYEVVHIPGRNGDLVIDQGSYQNVSRTYEIAFGDFGKDFVVMANAASEWLHSASGYARLEDSYEPEYYRLAMFQSEVTMENILQHAGRTTIEFCCKPQRFLKSGEEMRMLSDDYNSLYNPTAFISLPRIAVYGQGTGLLIVEGCTVKISNLDGSIVLDSDIQDAYEGSVNRNRDVVLMNGIFPKLFSGENTIRWTGGITRVEVVPRWWTL